MLPHPFVCNPEALTRTAPDETPLLWSPHGPLLKRTPHPADADLAWIRDGLRRIRRAVEQAPGRG